MMPLPSAGLTTLQPVPATNRQSRKPRKDGEHAPANRPTRAERQAAEQARPHPQSIGEAAAGEREEQATEIDGRDKERDLQAAEAEAVDQARRERRDAEHPERAGAVARRQQRQQQPAIGQSVVPISGR